MADQTHLLCDDLMLFFRPSKRACGIPIENRTRDPTSLSSYHRVIGLPHNGEVAIQGDCRMVIMKPCELLRISPYRMTVVNEIVYSMPYCGAISWCCCWKSCGHTSFCMSLCYYGSHVLRMSLTLQRWMFTNRLNDDLPCWNSRVSRERACVNWQSNFTWWDSECRYRVVHSLYVLQYLNIVTIGETVTPWWRILEFIFVLIQVARARELFNWTGSFGSVAGTLLLLGAMKTKNPAMVAPLLPIGWVLGKTR